MAKLKPWYHVVTPREDLRENRPLDASEFAVHLDHVRHGRAHDDYTKPERFFDCGKSRDGNGYKLVTPGENAEAKAARDGFANILAAMPEPKPRPGVAAAPRARARQRNRQ